MSGPTVEKSPSRGVALTWLDEETLEMKMADNTTYKIILTVAKNIPGVVDPCVFSGTIAEDEDALVSASGCKDEHTEVAIASRKILGGLVELSLEDGKTYQMTVHYPGEKAKKNRFRREAGLRQKRGVYDALGPRPDPVILEISLRYDNRLLAEFDDNPTKVVQWLNKVVGLAKIRMSLIHRRVVLRVVGSAERFNKNIRLDTKEDAYYYRNMIKDTLKNKWTRGPISYFCGSSNVICCNYFIVLSWLNFSSSIQAQAHGTGLQAI